MNQALQALAMEYNMAPLPAQERFSTGIAALDGALGGGVPKGRILEIYGGEDSGKSALALHLASHAGGPALLIDAERKLPPWRIPNGFYAAFPETLEDALGMCRMAAQGGFAAVVIDTLTALPTREDLKADFDCCAWKKPPAKILAKALPILAPILLSSGCTLILTSQMREIPNVMYGNPERSTGGRALRYYAALRLRLTRLETIVVRGTAVGQKMRVKAVKNKYGTPFREADLTLSYSCGLLGV